VSLSVFTAASYCVFSISGLTVLNNNRPYIMRLHSSNSARQLLIVEDEPAVGALIATTLRMANYEVTIAQNAQQAQEALLASSYAAMVVDWMLPNMSGVALIGKLRQQSQFRQLPILMLTARAQENDKINGLEAGADDYLTKPFSPRELVARVNALLRRAQPLQDDTEISVGVITLNPAQASVFYQAPQGTHLEPFELKLVTLSHTEFKLLQCLMLQPKRVHSREQLLSQAWDKDSQIDVRTVDAHIKRLRQALLAVGCEGYIHTVRGMGYTLNGTI
jgi:two-component system, OmpR family, phosphate regulon response regulator PhoB